MRPSNFVSSTTTSSGTRKMRVTRERVRQVHVRRVRHMITSVVAMKAILLAGGKGTRLRPLTIHTPKPIVPIFERPFLHYQLDLLKQVPEIDEVILSLNYQPRRIEEIFGDGSDSGLEHPLRRRAGAARHGRRRPLRRRVAARVGRRVQRRRADAGRSGGGHRAAPRAQGQGDDRADAGRQPAAPTGWSRPTRRATSGGSSRSRSPTRSPATRSTPASTSSSRTPSTAFPKDTPWSIERSFFPSLIERGETFVAYVYRGYWIDIGTPEKYMQVHRDIMDGRYRAAPFAGEPRTAWVSPEARVEEGATRRRALLHRRGRGRQGRRAHRPVQRRRPPVPHRGARRRRRSRSSGPTRASARKRSSGGRSSAATATSAAAPSSRTASCSATSRSSPTTAGSRDMTASCDLNPDIFKAYDIRGIYPDEINEDGARAIGAAFVAYLKAQADRGRPRHAALVAGAGRGVHRRRDRAGRRRRRLRDDSDRHALLRRGARRPRRRRARSPRRTIPKQYNGMKMVRQEAFPLSGDEGIADIRDMIAARPPAAAGAAPRRGHDEGRARRLRRARDVVHRSGGHPAVQRRARRRQRHGRARRAEAVRSAALPDDAALLRDRRPLPESRSQSAHRGEPPRHRRARRSPRRPTSASPGTATPTAASSSTAPASSSPATSSRRCSPRRSC